MTHVRAHEVGRMITAALAIPDLQLLPRRRTLKLKLVQSKIGFGKHAPGPYSEYEESKGGLSIDEIHYRLTPGPVTQIRHALR